MEPQLSDNRAILPESVRTALAASGYSVERELGRGGMATVYLAQDVKHDRRVALKVLHEDLTAALGSERFQREIRLAARLQHPHVLSVFDSGDAAGRLWYTMPYVDGESLRERLDRQRQLTIDDAVRIVSEAAQGLQYAHQHGIIHRDVKPENILLTEDGTTLVADFGIARATGADVTVDGGERLTATGLAIGTPAYMSPEQAAGDRDIDARADVYALGAVLYEALAGEPPFTGPTPQAVIAKRLATPAPSIRVVRPAVPVELAAALSKALASVPADRFATAAEFASALRDAPRIAAQPSKRRASYALIAAALLLMAGGAASWLHGHTGSADTRATIAVLPFDNLGESADAYFADGVADEVRAKLAGLRQLRVIASASSRQYRGTTKQPRDIARELGVRYLLFGRVQWQKRSNAPSRVRVEPELVDVAGGSTPATTWQQNFDADLSEVFRVQSEIAEQVAGALRTTLRAPEQAALTAAPTRSLDAYDAFLRGRELLSLGGLDPASLRRAADAFRDAVQQDSTFVRAWLGLSYAYVAISIGASGSQLGADSARLALEHARALAPNLPDVRAAEAIYEGNVRGDWDRSLSDGMAALTKSPNDVQLLNAVATAEDHLGRWDAEAAHRVQLLALDPRSAGAATALGFVQLRRHRVAEARAALDRALVLQPARPDARVFRAAVDVDDGDSARARAILRGAPPTIDSIALLVHIANYDLSWLLDAPGQRRFRALSADAIGDRGFWGLELADSYAVAGDTTRARAYGDSARSGFRETLTANPNDPELLSQAALASAYAGQKAEALEYAARAESRARVVNDAVVTETVREFRIRALLVVGERGRAIDELEIWRSDPRGISSGRLRVDPHFSPLRDDVRFRRLLNANKQQT